MAGFALRAFRGPPARRDCQPTEGRPPRREASGLDSTDEAAQHGTPPKAGNGTNPDPPPTWKRRQRPTGSR